MWRGAMDWPVDEGWKCQTCEASSFWLVWGFIHAHCRCVKCHTEYFMRDENKQRVTRPICLLKDEYKTPARVGWLEYKTPVDEWSDEQWASLGVPNI